MHVSKKYFLRNALLSMKFNLIIDASFSDDFDQRTDLERVMLIQLVMRGEYLSIIQCNIMHGVDVNVKIDVNI